MKADLDAHLERERLEGLLVVGPAKHNPSMAYFTGPAHLGGGYLARRTGSEPRLYVFPMEREEAARTGLRSESLEWHAANKQAEGNPFETHAILLERILRDNEMTGRVLCCGITDAGFALETVSRLRTKIPSLELVGFPESRSPLNQARATKDETELTRIRQMGQRTIEVVGWVADFLTSQDVRDGLLVNRTGEVVRVGDVKRRINLWLAERGLENPEGTIFAIGHDAGVPHSVGRDDQPIPVGQPIVFDIFPCEGGGGYFYDLTRTWCLGHAPDEVEQVYQDVREAYRRGMDQVHEGVECRALQIATCEFFEERGHPTVLNTPETLEGYVHSLGHGLGLAVHEPPHFHPLQEPPDILTGGHVVTIEPGLYYPSRNLGVRLEDTVAVGPNGAEVLAPYPMDLVLPMRGNSRGQTKSRVQAKKAKPSKKRSG